MEHPSQGWDQALHLAPLSRMRDGSPRLLSIYRGHLHFQRSNFPTHSQQRREVLGSSAIGDLQSAVLTQCVHISQRREPEAHGSLQETGFSDPVGRCPLDHSDGSFKLREVRRMPKATQ